MTWGNGKSITAATGTHLANAQTLHVNDSWFNFPWTVLSLPTTQARLEHYAASTQTHFPHRCGLPVCHGISSGSTARFSEGFLISEVKFSCCPATDQVNTKLTGLEQHLDITISLLRALIFPPVALARTRSLNHP